MNGSTACTGDNVTNDSAPWHAVRPSRETGLYALKIPFHSCSEPSLAENRHHHLWRMSSYNIDNRSTLKQTPH